MSEKNPISIGDRVVISRRTSGWSVAVHYKDGGLSTSSMPHATFEEAVQHAKDRYDLS